MDGITCLEFSPAKENEEAGLTIYAEEKNHYEIAVTAHDGKKRIVVKWRIGALSGILGQVPFKEEKVYLRIESSPAYYRLNYSTDGKEFKQLGQMESKYLESPQFTGAYFGLYATGNGKKSSRNAIFHWFEYKTLN